MGNAEKKKSLSLGKVAGYCGVTRKTILRWVQEGLMPSFTLPSGHHRVLPEDVAAFLEKHGMPVPPELASERQMTALIADDDDHIRRLIADLLKPYFLVTEAANGVEACFRIGAEAPDLLLLDVRMPRMDGISVCRQIHQDPKLTKTKIVVISAHISHEVEESLEGIAYSVIKKPFAPKELIAACLSAVRSSDTVNSE